VRLGSRLIDFWFEPIDPVRLDTFRRVFTATWLYYVSRWMWQGGYEWLSTEGFHVRPSNVRWWHWTPPPPLPPSLVPVFYLLVIVAAGAILLGWRPRPFTWLALLLAIYAKAVDPLAAFTLNKLYIMGFAVMAFAPSPRAVAGADGVTVVRQSAWPVRVLQGTLLIQYFTAGTCKVMHGDWLNQTDVLWTQVQGYYRTDLAAWMLRELPLWSWAVMMYSALLFEITAPITFGWKRLRPLAYVWGFGFQMMIAATMRMLILFSLQMVSFYVLFVQAKNLHAFRAAVARALGRLVPGRPRAAS
jgi:hypothetical protein